MTTSGAKLCAAALGGYPYNPGMTALYLERYSTMALTRRSCRRQPISPDRINRRRPRPVQPPSISNWRAACATESATRGIPFEFHCPPSGRKREAAIRDAQKKKQQ